MSKPTVSCAIMVQDNVQTIRAALESVRPHVDEIVVVDHMSKDGTADICREYADVYHRHRWPKHFGKARTRSLRYCTGDMIFVLDSDDVVTQWDAPEDAYCMGRVLVESDMDNGSNVIQQTRFIPNRKDVYYIRPVHNRLVRPVDLLAVDTGTHLLHTGYRLTPEERQGKFMDRLELNHAAMEELKAEWDEKPDDGKLRTEYYMTVYQTASAYNQVSDHSRVMAYAAKAWKYLPQERMEHALMMLCRSSIEAKRIHDAKKWGRTALRLSREALPYYFGALALGYGSQKTGDKKGEVKAVQALARSFEMPMRSWMVDHEFMFNHCKHVFGQYGLKATLTRKDG